MCCRVAPFEIAEAIDRPIDRPTDQRTQFDGSYKFPTARSPSDNQALVVWCLQASL